MEFIKSIGMEVWVMAVRWVLTIGLLFILHRFVKTVGTTVIDIKVSMDKIVSLQEQMLEQAKQTNKSVLKISTAEEENERRIEKLKERVEEHGTFMELIKRASDGGK